MFRFCFLIVAVVLAGFSVSCGGESEQKKTKPAWLDYPLKVHVYNSSAWNDSYGVTCVDSFVCRFTQFLLKSKYYEPDGDKADYYYIPHYGHLRGFETLKLFQGVKEKFPWWNRTKAAGQVRHIILLTGDHGPGQAYDRPITFPSPEVPDDIHPANPNRLVAFVQWNGQRDGANANQDTCIVCFQTGKDIMMPQPEGNVCGTLCGFPLEKLRQYSPWARNKELVAMEVERQRKFRLFYGGLIVNPDPKDYTGRGGIYHYHVNKTSQGYLIVRKGEHPPVDFAVTMSDTNFCFSPLGQHGGDSDRHVPAVLLGCIPVMLNSSHYYNPVPNALPLEEVLPWHRFGTVVHLPDMAQLDAQLSCLMPFVSRMRAQLAKVWRAFIYTGMFRSYLGESPAGDAFERIMSVLKLRASHGYRTPDHVRERLLNRTAFFPCLNGSTAHAHHLMHGGGGFGSGAHGDHHSEHHERLR